MKKLLKSIEEFCRRSAKSKKPDLNFVENPCWEIDSPQDCVLFFRNIGKIMPTGVTLYVEGTAIAAEVEEFYKQRSVPCSLKIAAGTIWPKPRAYHIPIRQITMETLAALAERHAWPEVCDHLRIHNGHKLLMHWFDFPADPLCIAGTVKERDIFALCNDIDSTFKRI